jgi:hypothetical protein
MAPRTGSFILYLYPVIYGVVALLSINTLLVKTSFTEVSSIAGGTSILAVFFVVIEILQKNVYLLSILIILTIAEVVRVVVLDVRELILIEAVLLFMYVWNIFVSLIYILFAYIVLNILQNFITTKIYIDNVIITGKTGTGNAEGFRGLVFVSLGTTILMHILYSYFIPIKTLSLLLYVVALMFTELALYRFNSTSLANLYMVAAAIPPFGVVLVIQKMLSIGKLVK